MRSLREDGDGIREGKPRTGKTRWDERAVEEDEVIGGQDLDLAAHNRRCQQRSIDLEKLCDA